MRGFSGWPACLGVVFLLSGCGSAPPQPVTEPPAEPPVSTEVPELTLNLPDDSCNCPPAEQTDYTFLERGYSAIARGEHIEAVQHLNRYLRLESSPAADWETGIAIAYISALPSSPFYDPREARTVYRRLKSQLESAGQVHDTALLMRDTLEIFTALDAMVRDLRGDVERLSEDLAKREEALKRLRELTLGE